MDHVKKVGALEALDPNFISPSKSSLASFLHTV